MSPCNSWLWHTKQWATFADLLLRWHSLSVASEPPRTSSLPTHCRNAGTNFPKKRSRSSISWKKSIRALDGTVREAYDTMKLKCIYCGDTFQRNDRHHYGRCSVCSEDKKEIFCTHHLDQCECCDAFGCDGCGSVNSCSTCGQTLCIECMGEAGCAECDRVYYCTDCLDEKGLCSECA